METATKTGGQVQFQPGAGGSSEEFIVRFIADWLNEVLASQGANGAVIRTGTHQRHRNLIAEVVPLLEGDSPEIRISCSKFSQSMGLGALLYILSGTDALDLGKDIEVFHWLKGEFARLSPESPAKVMVEHAHLLDLRSERILCKLVASGCIRLILLTDQIESLGTLFSLLLRQRALEIFNPFWISQADFITYMERRLAGKISAQVRAHYWSGTHGDLGSLETLLESDLERRALRTVEGTWVLDTTISPLTECRRSFDRSTVRLSAIERQLLRQIEGQPIVHTRELNEDGDQAKALERLFLLGLVENAGAGRIKSKYQAHLQKMVEQGIRHCQGISDARLQGTVLENVTGTFPGRNTRDPRARNAKSPGSTELKCQRVRSSLDRLAGFCASMSSCDIAGATKLLDAAQAAQPNDPELSVQRWYLEVRSGHWPQTWFNDDSTDGIVRCLNDRRWPDEATRIAGVLCIAYDWNLSGKLIAAARLVRWAVAALKRSGTYLRDERLVLWHSHLVFMVYNLSSNLRLWQVMDQMDQMLENSEYQDSTAAGFMAYFGALRQLHHGKIKECQKVLSTVIAQDQSSPYPLDARVTREIAALTRVMGGYCAQTDSSVVACDDIPSPSRTIHWSYSYVRFLRRAYQCPDEKLKVDLAEYIRQALAHGHNFSAFMAISISLALGFAIPRERMSGLIEAMEDNTAHELHQLNEALLANDEHLAVEIACRIAAHGLFYHAALPLNRMHKGKTVLRRKLRRCISTMMNLTEENNYTDVTASTATSPHNDWHVPLTSRERRVAAMAARGLRNSELAEHFGISVRTVEGHLYQIHVKLGLRNRRELKALVAGGERGPGK